MYLAQFGLSPTPSPDPGAPGRFQDLNSIAPEFWHPEDLDLPRAWQEGKRRGWVLSGYESFSIQSIPWEQLKREDEIGPWKMVKRSTVRRVVRARLSTAPNETLYVKWVRIYSWYKAFGCLFRRSKVAREFALARRLLASGIATPTPILVAERRRGPVLMEAFLVTRGLDEPHWRNARDLWAEWRSDPRQHPQADELLRDLAATIRRAHDLGWVHNDCRALHWLRRMEPDTPETAVLPDTPEPDSEQSPDHSHFLRWAVLDLDGSALNWPPTSARRRSLLTLMMSSFPRPLWTAEDAHVFLAGYYGAWMPDEKIVSQMIEAAERLHEKGARSRNKKNAASSSSGASHFFAKNPAVALKRPKRVAWGGA